MNHFDVAIVGAGPAGVAAALQIRDLPAGKGARVCLIDAARFPRSKLCGGGITRRTEELLASLGVRVSVPTVDVDEVRFVLPTETTTRRSPRSFRVIRRDELDAFLVQESVRRGIALIEGEAVERLLQKPELIELQLGSERRLEASIVIGADGANSIVRRCLVPGQRRVPPFVALEVLTPGHDNGAGHRATFDFRPIVDGVRGYAWDFPSVIGGEPFMNRGIAAIGKVPQRALKTVFRDVLAERGIDLDAHSLEGAWAPVYDPERLQGASRVLLAGDAVGIDPWLGEGISSAIGTGIIAGHVAAEALRSGQTCFDTHHHLIRSGTIGQTLLKNAQIAATFYGPPPGSARSARHGRGESRA